MCRGGDMLVTHTGQQDTYKHKRGVQENTRECIILYINIYIYFK